MQERSQLCCKCIADTASAYAKGRSKKIENSNKDVERICLIKIHLDRKPPSLEGELPDELLIGTGLAF
jgi:hypothetical protein